MEGLRNFKVILGIDITPLIQLLYCSCQNESGFFLFPSKSCGINLKKRSTGIRFGDFVTNPTFGELGGTGFQAAPIYAKYCFPGVKGWGWSSRWPLLNMGDGDRCQLWPVGKVLHVEDTLLISTRSVWNGLQFPCSFLFEHDSEVTHIASKQCCCVYISKWNIFRQNVFFTSYNWTANLLLKKRPFLDRLTWIVDRKVCPHDEKQSRHSKPQKPSMYGIVTYIWLFFNGKIW